MWPQAIFFFVFMMMSLLVVAMFEVISATLGGVMGTMAALLAA
jgi:hypothetical protein